MAEKREIEIDISLEDGTVTADALGFQGKECEDVLDAIQKALAGQTEESTKKKEYEQRVQRVTINKQSVKRS